MHEEEEKELYHIMRNRVTKEALNPEQSAKRDRHLKTNKMRERERMEETDDERKKSAFAAAEKEEGKR